MFQQKFNVPDLKASTLAVDANRRIIVADSASRCIHVISLDTGELHKPDHVILLSDVPLDFNVSIDKRKIRNEKKVFVCCFISIVLLSCNLLLFSICFA